MSSNDNTKTYSFLQKGGEMGELTRNYNWEATILGTPDHWPQSLRTTISIIINSKFPMFLWWGEKLIQFYNDAYRPSMGNEGKHPAALGQFGEDCWPEIWPDIKPLIDQVIETGEAIWRENEFLPIYRNGRLEDVYWTFCYSPVYNEAGRVAGVLVTCSETTEEVMARERIKVREQNLHNIILQAPVGMCIMLGKNYRVEIANERMYEVWGTNEESILGKPLFEVLHEAQGQGFEALLDHVYETGITYKSHGLPVTLRRGSKLETIYVDLVYEAFREASGAITGIIAVVMEVTDQQVYIKKIEEAEERARMAIESAGLGFYELNMRTGEVISDKRMQEIFGSDEPLTRQEFVEMIHPDDLPARTRAYQHAAISGHLGFEARIIINEENIRWIKVSGKMVFDENNIPVKVQGVMQDITTLKELEYQKDDFIGVVSHELKTPLTTLKGYAYILAEKFTNSEDQKTAGMLNKIKRQVDRLNYIVKDLLDVTRIEVNKIRFRQDHFNFSEEVEKIVEEIQTTTHTHSIIFENKEAIFITADLERISQVITNLLLNAIRYSPQGSHIEVSTWESDSQVFCSVKDFGKGIDKADHHKIFDRYFQISDSYRSNSGFGLGLYISAQIIKRQNGHIWVESETGKGSTFFISLPLLPLKNAE